MTNDESMAQGVFRHSSINLRHSFVIGGAFVIRHSPWWGIGGAFDIGTAGIALSRTLPGRSQIQVFPVSVAESLPCGGEGKLAIVTRLGLTAPS